MCTDKRAFVEGGETTDLFYHPCFVQAVEKTEWDTPCFALLLRVKCASLSDAWRNFLPVVHIVQISCHGYHLLAIYTL